MARYLYSELATLIDARKRCIETNNDFANTHQVTIERLVRDHMPSGSGFDNGTQIDLDKSHAGRLVFSTAFHHMNETGYYDGWTEHTVRVTPSFLGGFDIRVSGRNRNDIKEYICETFGHALEQDLCECCVIG